MLTFLARLWMYFGLIGILSLLLWTAAAATAGVGFLKLTDRRTKLAWVAVGLAALGFFSAKINSHFVSRVQIDRTAQEEEFREAQRREALRQERESRKEIMFAEEGVRDMETLKHEREAEELDDEDITPGIEEATVGTGAEPDDARNQPQVPLYKQRGKAERAEGKTEELADVEATVKDAKESKPSGKMLKEEDKIRAEHWDRANLFMGRWTLVIVLFLAVADYVRRFNRTFDVFLPLPLSCPWLDRLSPKSTSVLLTKADRTALAHHLRNFVRRGETYVYFGPSDPVAEPLLARVGPADIFLNERVRRFVSWLYDIPKMHVHGRPTPDSGLRPPLLDRLKDRCIATVAKRWPNAAEHADLLLHDLGRLGKHLLRRLPPALVLLVLLLIPFLIFFTRSSYYLPHYILTMCLAPWPILLSHFPSFAPVLPKLRDIPDSSPKDRDFFFDAAWFGRCCAVIDDPQVAETLLDELRRYLKARRVPNARSPQTVNIVWDFGRLPENLDRKEFFDLCAAANFRFVHVSERIPAQADTFYSEVHDG